MAGRETLRLFSKTLERELSEHAGQWVATTHDTLLAFNASIDQLIADLQRRGISDYILMQVPEPDVELYFQADRASR